MIKLIISLFLFAMVPGSPILTSYVLMKHIKAWRELPREKQTKIKLMSFGASLIFMILFLLHVLFF